MGKWLFFAIFLGCLMGLGRSPAIVLKDGSQVRFSGTPSTELNMISVQTEKGRLLLSKGLIDWSATKRSAPSVFQCCASEQTRLAIAEEERRARERRGKRTLVITDETLENLKPGQGLSNVWEEPATAASPDAKAPPPASSGLVSRTPIIQRIAKAKKVSLNQHLEPGRYVIFDFYADWCGPCRVLTPKLEALVRKYPHKVALKKIDIVNWGTPVARQYGIRSIPYVKVYAPSGNEVTSGHGNRAIRYLNNKAAAESW